MNTSACLRFTVSAIAVLAVGLCRTAGPASAQPGADKTGATPANAPPQPAPVPSEPGSTTASFGDWVLRCQRGGEGDKAIRLCEVVQSIQVQGQAHPIVQVAIGRAGRNDPLRVAAVLPVAIAFPSSVRILVGDQDARGFDLSWRRCLPGGCFADAPAEEAALKRWRTATEAAKLTFKDAAGRDVSLPVSVRGFGQALDALAKEKL